MNIEQHDTMNDSYTAELLERFKRALKGATKVKVEESQICQVEAVIGNWMTITIEGYWVSKADNFKAGATFDRTN